MALLPGGGFNAEEVTPGSGFDPIPPGQYVVMITDSEMKETSSKTGEMLKLTFKVLEGEFEGRYLWSNLNLVNQSEKAVEIAQRELSAICHACDVLNPEDSSELHGIPMIAKVKVNPPKDGYDANNSISGFKSMDEATDNDDL